MLGPCPTVEHALNGDARPVPGAMPPPGDRGTAHPIVRQAGGRRRTVVPNSVLLWHTGHPGVLMPPTVYRVYVIELARRVFTEDTRFRAANPQYNGVLQCLYVGMTSKTPQERFLQHRTGYRNAKGHKLSAAIVQRYGLYLRPSLYQHIGPLSRAEALEVEKGLTLELRRKGYAVWSN